MKYIKTFESIELQNVEKEQFAKLAVLKFTRKITELFKEIYHYNLKFVEEESNKLCVANYKLKRLGTPMISISITLNKRIEIYFGFVLSGEFKDFLRLLFKGSSYDKKSLSVDELNKISDEIKDEWYLYLDTKKYNL